MTICFELIHLCPIFPNFPKFLRESSLYSDIQHLQKKEKTGELQVLSLFIELDYFFFFFFTLLSNVNNFIRLHHIALNLIVLH